MVPPDHPAGHETALTAHAVMVAHRTRPTGSIIVNALVESIEVLTDQSKEPAKMLITPGRELMDIYLRSFGLDQLPDFAPQFILLHCLTETVGISRQL